MLRFLWILFVEVFRSNRFSKESGFWGQFLGCGVSLSILTPSITAQTEIAKPEVISGIATPGT